MNQTTRRVFGVAGFALLLATSASFAQQPAPVRVRGTVEAVDGPMLTVKSRDGQTTYKVKLTDISEADEELVEWIRQAYESAG